jgi:Na+/H+-dicarboxylate symporter
MIKNVNKNYKLTPEACDEIAELIMEFCSGIRTDRKDALRYRLSAEECLLYWMSHGCEGKTVILDMGRHLFVPYISIEVEGEAINPYSDDDEEFGYYTDNILASLGLGPEYSYDTGFNRIRFRVKRKSPGQIVNLVIVMAAAILVGVMGMAVFPDGLRSILLAAVVEPVYNTFFNILGCIAGPMIFMSVAWGVYGIGDAATLGKIGRKMMLRYIGTTIQVCACCVAFFPAFVKGLSSGTGSEGQLSSIAELILSIFPSTIVEPFATGNTLQIIFLAIVIGIALLYLGKRAASVARAIEQTNLLVNFLMEVISKLVPFVIFLVIVNMIWSGSVDVMLSSWKFIVVLAIAFIFVAVAFITGTSVKQKVSAGILISKSMPTFIVALTTASSAAAFSSNMTTCEKKFGIEPSLIRFGIPLGMVMHKPIAAVYNLLLVFYFAGRYGVNCSVGWIAVAVFICSIIAIATPPIPGGGAVAYSIIFAQMGIPTEAMAVALAIDIITDFMITAFEMFVLPLSLINESAGLGMIDLTILRSK